MARMLPIKAYLSLPEALVVASYLDDHGVLTALNGFHHGSMAWHCLYALNGIQVCVLDIDFDRARELVDHAPSLSDPEAKRDGHDRGRPTLSDIALAAAAFLLIGLPMPVWLRRPFPGRD
jgi:hypothetical protein